MPRLMPYVDICIGNGDDIEMTLGLPPEAEGMRGGILDAGGSRTVFHALSRKYGVPVYGCCPHRSPLCL